jgi:glycosyltransferase involved in cell wall biosynthesis
MHKENSIVFLPAYLDACAMWRMFMPHLNLPGSGFVIFSGRPDYRAVTEKEVAVMQRCCTREQFDIMVMLRQLKMKLIYELDDNVWELPEINPAYQILTAHKEGFLSCIRQADVISVSTRNLAKAVRRHIRPLINQQTGKGIPIVVTENRMDTRMFCPAEEHEELVVGWAGSTSHMGDLLLLTEAIQNISAETPKLATFEFRGLVPPKDLALLPTVRHKPWLPLPEYGIRMPRWGWSIALAPVTVCEFNEAKSNIKMIEAGWCRIPCLASHTDQYDRFCSHDPELRWLLCAGWSVWERKIRELINDKDRRKDLGRRMREVVMQYYTFDTPHEGWEELLETVAGI